MASTTVQAVPKFYDVIIWLLGRVERFPRSQKFTLGDRTVNLALDTLELLIEATYTQKRLPLLQKANVQLEKLRLSHSVMPRFQVALRKTVCISSPLRSTKSANSSADGFGASHPNYENAQPIFFRKSVRLITSSVPHGRRSAASGFRTQLPTSTFI